MEDEDDDYGDGDEDGDGDSDGDDDGNATWHMGRRRKARATVAMTAVQTAKRS